MRGTGLLGFLKHKNRPSTKKHTPQPKKPSNKAGTPRAAPQAPPSSPKTAPRTPPSAGAASQTAAKASPPVPPKPSPLRVPSCAGIETETVLRECRRISPPLPAQDIQIFCPVKRVRICCYSSILDKMSPLTKFIIRSISGGKTLEELNALTQIGARTIEDEIAYLRKGKLLEEEGPLQLTQLGRDHSRLIGIFDRLSNGVDARLNLYTDRFEESSFPLYSREELEEDSAVLEGKLSKVLLQNPNYSNSLELMRPFLEEGIPFLKEVAESLYTLIKLEKGDKPLYQKLILPDGSQGEGQLQFCLPVQEIHCRLRISALDPFRSVLDTLDKLEVFGEQLLSDRSLRLVKGWREEKAAPEYTIRADLFHGTIAEAEEELLERPPEGSFVLRSRYPRIQFELEEGPKGLGRQFYLAETGRQDWYLPFSCQYSQLVPEESGPPAKPVA